MVMDYTDMILRQGISCELYAYVWFFYGTV